MGEELLRRDLRLFTLRKKYMKGLNKKKKDKGGDYLLSCNLPILHDHYGDRDWVRRLKDKLSRFSI